jgi:hypothetical protein
VSSTEAVAFSPEATPTTGTLAGRVRICGGPSPPKGGTHCWGEGGIVSVFDSTRRRVAREHTTAHARFDFRLPAGRYRLVARISRKPAQQLLAERRAPVHVGRTTRARIVIGVP